MRSGHSISAVGAMCVVAGTTLLDWQQFAIAGVAVNAVHVGATGQIVFGLAGATLATIVVVGHQRMPSAAAVLTLNLFALVALVVAYLTRDSAFHLMPDERATMASGYYVALCGTVIAAFGALVCFASDPRPPEFGGWRQLLARFDETLGSAIAVSAAAQLSFVVLAVVLWREEPHRDPHSARQATRQLNVQAVVREPEDIVVIVAGDPTVTAEPSGERGRDGETAGQQVRQRHERLPEPSVTPMPKPIRAEAPCSRILRNQ